MQTAAEVEMKMHEDDGKNASDGVIRVLLVEDDPADVKLVQMALSGSGHAYETEVVGSISAATERLHAGRFDVVLLDLGLPDSRGLDTVSKIHDGHPRIPVAVLTGLDDEEAGICAMQRGAQDYLVKGDVTSRLLTRSIRYAIERKRAEEEIMEERNRAEFYNDLLSHDINNMNLVAMGHLEMLLRMPNFHNEFKRHVHTALNQVRESANLITNVKKFTMIKSGRIELKTMDIYPPLKKATDVAEASSSPGRVRIDSNITEGRYFTCGSELLFDVFSNLLNNSIKFDEHETVEIDVGISSSDDEKYWVIEFKDLGPGVDDDLKGAIFNRLERGHASVHGSGLGLTIVKTIVESYGGTVWVEDRVAGDRSQGSNFVVLLPRRDELRI
ncbi:MAG TPA: response regulator [Methanosarcinales archaeon]|nr:response regulator [Methanosarcinales archaeon]